jgi:PAS domain S-box-containing protein
MEPATHKTTVLVVEDNAITRKVMRVALESGGYDVLEAEDGKTAIRLAKEKQPTLVLQDLLLPDVDGLDLVRDLRRALQGRKVPIVACTGLLSKLDDARSIQGGFTDFVFKPVEPSQLIRLVARYLAGTAANNGKPRPRRKILLVNDNPIELKLEKLMLEGEGFAVNTAKDGKEGLALARKAKPDAVLTDLIMPRMSGFDLCVALRKAPKLADLPVVIATSAGVSVDGKDRRLAKKLGADALVTRTADLKDAVRALNSALKRRSRPKPAANAKILRDDYLQRVLRRLEQQTTRNAEAISRAAEEKVQLAVVSSITETLNRRLHLKAVLDEALACILDAAGISRGAIYLVNRDGDLVLQSQLGHQQSQTSELEEFFGHRVLLYRALTEPTALTVPSDEVAPEVAEDLCKRVGAQSLLIAPLAVADEPQGVLVAFAARRELTSDWVNSVKTVTVQLAQAVLLARTMERITESEQRFRELAENIREIFFVRGPKGVPLYYVSPAYEEITGRSRQRLYRNPNSWLEAIHPDDRERVETVYKRSPNALDLEYRIVRPDGNQRWLRARTFEVRDESGAAVRVVGIAEDITDRKRAEDEIRRNLERIRALHEIDLAISSTLDLQTILDVLLEKVQIFLPIAAASVVRLMNPATGDLEQFAYRGDERAEWLTQLTNSRNRRARRIIETREPLWVRNLAQGPLAARTDFFRSHGLVSYLGVPLVTHDHAIGVLGLYTREEHEFTPDEIEFLSTLAGQAAIAIHNAQLFERVNHQARELEKANSVKEEFLGVMSHELRTPLNITIGYVGMMKDGMLGTISQEQRSALQKVMNQTADQLRMINDILVTTHLESRAMVVDHDRVDLSDLFRSLKSDFDVIHDDEEPELRWDFPSEPLWVVTDRRKLRQILQNLVSNALKFTERGRITVSLRIPAVAPSPLPGADQQSDERPEHSTWLEISVSDTGIGIPPDELDLIFEKFRQVDSSPTRLYGGLGLGLYIARQFSTILGGKITVESEPGRGSTFTVTIPVGT